MGNDNSTTPKKLFQHLHKRFNFDLDAAASKENALLAKYHEEDVLAPGVIKPWIGFTRVFCNPPYSQVAKWVEHASIAYNRHGISSVLLLPVRADQSWWHSHVITNIRRVEWYKGRLSFGGHEPGKVAFMYNINLVFGFDEVGIISSLEASLFNSKIVSDCCKSPIKKSIPVPGGQPCYHCTKCQYFCRYIEE